MIGKPIFDIIVDYMDELDVYDDEIVSLGKDFRLPTEPIEGINFADGAIDGIAIYHMGLMKLSEEKTEEMKKAMKIASNGDFPKADEALRLFVQNVRAIYFIDELQKFIIQNREQLDEKKIYNYALHLMFESDDTELVKVGMIILELYEQDEEDKKLVRLLGLCDEFTLFSIFIMSSWENGNTEIMNLAKGVYGWGRIHAVSFIKPETDEIKKWLLTDAIKNEIMPAYSGLECYKKAGVEKILQKGELTEEEFTGILEIIDAMLDEGPLPGISMIENPDEVVAGILYQSIKRKPLGVRESEVVRKLIDWQEGKFDK